MIRNLLMAGACATALAACSKPPASPAVDARADPSTGVASDGTQYTVRASDGASGGFQASAAGDQMLSATSETDAEYRRLLALPPIEDRFGPRVVIGADDRRPISNTGVFPESAQVLVVLPGGRCSGAMIGPDLVLTAGHCVHTGRGGQWMRSAVVYPGRSGATAPFGSCRAKKFYSVVGWTRSGDRNYDIGAIKLDCRIGERTGWMGFFWQSASLVGLQARVSSYPGDKPLEQWFHTDPVRSDTATTTTYLTDTVGGNSGSGVFTPTGGFGGCGPCIHTVHAYGAPAGNSGTRITRPLFDNLLAWRAEP